MKTLPAVVLFAAIWATHPSRAQEPAPSKPTAAAQPVSAPAVPSPTVPTTGTPAPATTAVAPTPDPAAAPPVVRLPITSVSTTESPTAEPGRVPVTSLTSAGLSGSLNWSDGGTELRQPAVRPANTNLSIDTRSILPRFTRPERKGFGGFLSSFANLFNPLAPTSEGSATRSDYWYDANIQSVPLPRGFQDERYHEPQLTLQVYSLEPNRKAP